MTLRSKSKYLWQKQPLFVLGCLASPLLIAAYIQRDSPDFLFYLLPALLILAFGRLLEYWPALKAFLSKTRGEND
jgi:hypothetical protein